MFYVSDGKVYVREGDHFRNVGFTAKDKVITRRELESTSVVMGSEGEPRGRKQCRIKSGLELFWLIPVSVDIYV